MIARNFFEDVMSSEFGFDHNSLLRSLAAGPFHSKGISQWTIEFVFVPCASFGSLSLSRHNPQDLSRARELLKAASMNRIKYLQTTTICVTVISLTENNEYGP